MKLLHFAHRLEADAFFKHYSLQPVPHWQGLYHTSDFYLYISGEGIYETTTKLTRVCSQFSIEGIINLGVAGTLSSPYSPGEAVSIRTSYSHSGVAPLFKSFSSADPEARVDCVSAHQRITSVAEAKKLSPMAPLVDRELWAVGLVAKELKLPFLSIKVVSDLAGEENACLQVKSEAQKFSQLLLEAFLKRHFFKESKKQEDPSTLLYLTQSQRHQLARLLKNLAAKKQCQEHEILASYLQKESIKQIKKPKDQSKKILELMEQEMAPFESHIHHQLQAQLAPLKAAGLKVQYDQQLDSKTLTLKARLNNQHDYQRTLETLQNWQWSDFEKLIDGELGDV